MDAVAIARAKWSTALDAGYQIIPNTLVRHLKELKLDALDFAILLNLNSHWWKPDDLPHPRPAVVAERLNVSTRTVERRLNRLQTIGLIERLEGEKKQGPNGKEWTIRRFDLSGLVTKLEDLAAQDVQKWRQQV